jgi:hypothetical protein
MLSSKVRAGDGLRQPHRAMYSVKAAPQDIQQTAFTNIPPDSTGQIISKLIPCMRERVSDRGSSKLAANVSIERYVLSQCRYVIVVTPAARLTRNPFL